MYTSTSTVFKPVLPDLLIQNLSVVAPRWPSLGFIFFTWLKSHRPRQRRAAAMQMERPASVAFPPARVLGAAGFLGWRCQGNMPFFGGDSYWNLLMFFLELRCVDCWLILYRWQVNIGSFGRWLSGLRRVFSVRGPRTVYEKRQIAVLFPNGCIFWSLLGSSVTGQIKGYCTQSESREQCKTNQNGGLYAYYKYYELYEKIEIYRNRFKE